MLHRELEESGKRLLVSKAPRNVFIVDRIVECWPDARFIFLLRHPGAIARSRHELRPQDDEDRNAAMVRRYGDALEKARQAHDGLTVRYEELASDPEAATRRLCEFLGVEWEPSMLEYGRFDHGRYRAGIGDWKEKIRSGEIQPPDPAPEEIPAPLQALAEAWGYSSAADPASAQSADGGRASVEELNVE